MRAAPTGPRAALCSARSGRAHQQYDKTAPPANEFRCIAARAAVTHGTLRISISSDLRMLALPLLITATASSQHKWVVGGERNPRATRSVRVPGAIVIASGVPSRDLLRGAAPFAAASRRRRLLTASPSARGAAGRPPETRHHGGARSPRCERELRGDLPWFVSVAATWALPNQHKLRLL